MPPTVATLLPKVSAGILPTPATLPAVAAAPQPAAAPLFQPVATAPAAVQTAAVNQPAPAAPQGQLLFPQAQPVATAAPAVPQPAVNAPAFLTPQPPPAPAAAGPAEIVLANLPAWLTKAPAVPDALDELGGGGGSYVQVLTKKSNKFQQLNMLGIQEGDWYVSTPAGVAKAHPLSFWMIECDVFMSVMMTTGAIVKATRDLTTNLENMEEHVVALIIVDVAGTLIPAKADFRRTSSTPGVRGGKAIRAAADPNSDWSADPANALAKSFGLPWGRVKMTSNTIRRISGGNGQPYYETPTTVETVNVVDMQRLAHALGDDVFLTDMNAAYEGYQRRVAQLSALCK